LTFKSKNDLLECGVYQSPKSPKSLIVIIKRLTESHFWKSKCAWFFIWETDPVLGKLVTLFKVYFL